MIYKSANQCAPNHSVIYKSANQCAPNHSVIYKSANQCAPNHSFAKAACCLSLSILEFLIFLQVSMPHPVKGECVYCFVSLKNVSSSAKVTSRLFYSVFKMSKDVYSLFLIFLCNQMVCFMKEIFNEYL